MLRHLHITNLAVIEETSLDFDAGMTAITGETGAGKSILLESLALLSGDRASPSLVRAGAKRAVMEAIFRVPADHPAWQVIEESGLEADEPGEILLRREIFATGKSRASINGRLSPLSQLKTLAFYLFEICGQHEQQSLLHAEYQRQFYDEFCGLNELLQQCRNAYENYQHINQQLKDLKNQENQNAQRQDFLKFQIDELEEVGIEAGEMELLEQERQRLNHLEELRRRAGEAELILDQGSQEQASASDLIGRAAGAVEAMAAHDESLASLESLMIDLQDKLQEASEQIRHYSAQLENEPGRLEEIDQRLSRLKRIMRKYGSENQAISALDNMKEELEQIDHWESNVHELEKSSAEAKRQLREVAEQIQNVRNHHKSKFIKSFQTIIQDFSMPKARIDIRFTECELGAHGCETVEILFSANPGEAPHPLHKTASGGELSRIMLAMRTMQAKPRWMPLLIFDEIDSGLSGSAVRRVGERLSALGQRGQLLCVTHHPTVAAMAKDHYRIRKSVHNERTFSQADFLTAEERKEEITRLLDGGKMSGTGMAMAEELLAASAN